MAYNGEDLTLDPLYLQTKSYDARADRKWFADIASEGVVNAGDFAVTVGAGTMTITCAAGKAWILGSDQPDQGMYRVYQSTAKSFTVPASDPTKPRIDTVILRIFDHLMDGSGLYKGRLEIVPGTATTGATLGNLTGANALTALTDSSLSLIVLAYILVPAAASSLTDSATNRLDARGRATLGSGYMVSNAPDLTSINASIATLQSGHFTGNLYANYGGAGEMRLASNKALYFDSGSSNYIYESSDGVLSTGGRLVVAGMDVARTPYGAQTHMEWGIATIGGGGTSGVTFTDAYGGAPKVVTANGGAVGDWPGGIGTTGFTLHNDGTAQDCQWIAGGLD